MCLAIRKYNLKKLFSSVGLFAGQGSLFYKSLEQQQQQQQQ
jgi:hypothetical protein